MPRLPKNLITAIKSQISLLDLAQTSGIALEKRGADFFGLCPFHSEARPSLSLNPEKQVFHCFCCGAKGSVIDWVMLRDKISFTHATELLSRQLSGEASKLPKFKSESSKEDLLGEVLAIYQQSLSKHDKAQKYLAQRGLDTKELIEHFKLGFADRSLGYYLEPTSKRAG